VLFSPCQQPERLLRFPSIRIQGCREEAALIIANYCSRADSTRVSSAAPGPPPSSAASAHGPPAAPLPSPVPSPRGCSTGGMLHIPAPTLQKEKWTGHKGCSPEPRAWQRGASPPQTQGDSPVPQTPPPPRCSFYLPKPRRRCQDPKFPPNSSIQLHSSESRERPRPASCSCLSPKLFFFPFLKKKIKPCLSLIWRSVCSSEEGPGAVTEARAEEGRGSLQRLLAGLSSAPGAAMPGRRGSGQRDVVICLLAREARWQGQAGMLMGFSGS